jgi:hypothetical protein
LMIGTESIVISYDTFTVSQSITVSVAAAISIEITTPPTKTQYIVGQTADYQGIVVTVTYEDSSTEVLAFEDLIFSGFDSAAAGSVTITVSYLALSSTFDITVIEEVVPQDYTEVLVPDAAFDTTNLVANTTLFTSIFSGENPASIADFDVLLGRVLNDAERNLQYSTAIYMTGTGGEKVIVVQTNGMSAFAVRIPDGMSAADITAFTFSMSGEGLVLGNTITFKPSFRFSSINSGIEYFHATNTGTNALAQSGALTIVHADFTRVGYHDYTVMLNQPALEGGKVLGNYIIMYMGNNGSFRDSTSTSLKISGFKFWTKDVVSEITLTTPPTKTTYVVGETFLPDGMVITPTYEVSIYGAPVLAYTELTFDYDFSTIGTKTVVIHYGEFTLEVEVTVIEAPEPV